MTTGRKAILMVSFGTSFKKAGEAAIGALEQRAAEVFSDYEVRRAFTSQKIIDKIKSRDGVVIDNVRMAVERLEADGFDTLIVQPTHVMGGYEYEDMMEELAFYQGRFAFFACGKPLLSDSRDFERMVEILTEETAVYRGEKTAVVYIGHGTGHAANSVYARLENCLRAAGSASCYIGTVEGPSSFEAVEKAVKRSGCRHVVLLPLMIVAGDHACHDIAGDQEDSWKTAFLKAGYGVTCILRGIGEYPGVQSVFMEHIRAAMKGQDESIINISLDF